MRGISGVTHARQLREIKSNTAKCILQEPLESKPNMPKDNPTVQSETILIGVADDQSDFRISVLNWFTQNFGTFDAAEVDKCLEQTGIEDVSGMENDYILISSQSTEFELLLCASLESFFDAVSETLKEHQRPLLFLDLKWGADESLGELFSLKTNSANRWWPVIIYSSSPDQDGINKAYSHLANGYVYKGTGESREEIFVDVVNYWLKQDSFRSPIMSDAPST